MSKKANPAIIGSFVVGALALVIVGVLMFGKGDFFSEKRTFVLFFNESIYGLDLGAPVILKGVKIGSVRDIKLNVDREKLDYWIPVLIELEHERMTYIEGAAIGEEVHIDQLVEIGLRAQLQMQSVVTGKLFVSLDLLPDEPVRLTGYESEYPEIPTIPTAFEEVADTATKIIEEIRRIPIDEIFEKINLILTSVKSFVDSAEVVDSLQAFRLAMKDASQLMKNIDRQVEPLSSRIEEATREVSATLEQAKKSLITLEAMMDEDSSVQYKLNNSIEQIGDAAQSIRNLSEYLERHPEALLKGKKGRGGK